MSEIIKTEAVVLRTVKYGESSKIVTFFTRTHGKVAAMVKGARSMKKQYGSPIDALSYVYLVFYHKDGREVQTVSQCDTIESFRHLPDDMEKIAVAMTAAELIYRIAPQHEPNPALFLLLVDTLRVLNDATKNAGNLLYSFEYHFTRILGFEMSVESCVSCGKVYSGRQKVVFDLERGSIICSGCRDKCRYPMLITGEAVEFLSRLSGSEAGSVITLKCGTRLRTEIGNFLRSYMSYHMPELDTLKSAGVFAKLLKSG